MIKKLKVENDWTLFLDRDGVINERLVNNYVKHPDDLVLVPGVTEALHILTALFKNIVVVTNQQGIGRGLMTNLQLDLVHKNMIQKVTESGGRIDAIFYSPDLKNTNSFTRKPSVGMGLKARKQFPSINFKRSIIVGDSYSDILFGHRLAMVTVLVGTDKDVLLKCAGILDYSFPNLISFARFIENKTEVNI